MRSDLDKFIARCLESKATRTESKVFSYLLKEMRHTDKRPCGSLEEKLFLFKIKWMVAIKNLKISIRELLRSG